MFSKEEILEFLKQHGSIDFEHLYFSLTDKGKIYMNCYPDCNCCQDMMSFDEFYARYGKDIKELK